MIALRALPLLWAIACAKTVPPEEVVEGLPEWMTKGEEVRLAVASKLLESGDTLSALDVIRQMRADGYDLPELDLLQGRALRMDGVTSEAERLLLLAHKRMARDPRPSAELCVLYADTERIEEAVERCTRATTLDPGDARSWNNLGFLLLARELPQDALLAAEKAIQIDATQSRYRNNLGMAQAALGREDQAYRTFQSTMPRADAAYMVGLVLERYEGPQEARVWYERALSIDPQHPQARAATDAPPTPAPPRPNPAVGDPPGPAPDPSLGSEEP